MPKKFTWLAAFFIVCLVSVFGFLLAPASASTCYGTLYEYFESPALVVQVGSTASCPGFPDQHDEDPYGESIQTPWFTTTPIVCPCSSGGGGGGGEDTEAPD